MYKLLLHPTERKSLPLLSEYKVKHPKIDKEFGLLETSTDLECPDLLVQTAFNNPFRKVPLDQTLYNWDDHCAFEFKFGQDCVSSLNSGVLEDEFTRMKAKYFDLTGVHFDGDLNPTYTGGIPLYLVIINEYDTQEEEQIISCVDLARANTIAANLNIRVIYCNTPDTFATNVFKAIRTPPKEIDLGQRFVKKSTGSEFNRSLQCYHGVTREIADCVETNWSNWREIVFQIDKRELFKTFKKFEECFTTESGRFMKANMEKFLKKVSGQ